MESEKSAARSSARRGAPANSSQFAVGAYAAASAVGWHYGGDIGPPFLGYLLMLGTALAVALLLGPLLERGVLRFFIAADQPCRDPLERVEAWPRPS